MQTKIELRDRKVIKINREMKQSYSSSSLWNSSLQCIDNSHCFNHKCCCHIAKMNTETSSNIYGVWPQWLTQYLALYIQHFKTSCVWIS